MCCIGGTTCGAVTQGYKLGFDLSPLRPAVCSALIVGTLLVGLDVECVPGDHGCARSGVPVNEKKKYQRTSSCSTRSYVRSTPRGKYHANCCMFNHRASRAVRCVGDSHHMHVPGTKARLPFLLRIQIAHVY